MIIWSILSGTIVNGVTVAAGSIAGVSVAAKLPERYRLIVLQSLGLVTITLGIDASVLHFAETVREFGARVDAGPIYGARLRLTTAHLGAFPLLERHLRRMPSGGTRAFVDQIPLQRRFTPEGCQEFGTPSAARRIGPPRPHRP